MKKLALLLLGILLGFLLCYFFFGKEEAAVGDVRVEEPVPDPTPPQGTIDSTEMKALSNAYNERHTIINRALNIDDNRSSWYSLDQMRQFLDYAEFKAKGTKHEMDGVRIYLGASGDGKGMTTMFIVPTSSSIPTGEKYSKGSLFNLSLMARAGGGDIPGADGMDYGGNGNPPGSGYPNPPQ